MLNCFADCNFTIARALTQINHGATLSGVTLANSTNIPSPVVQSLEKATINAGRSRRACRRPAAVCARALEPAFLRECHQSAVYAWCIFGIADLGVAVTMGAITSPGRPHFLALEAFFVPTEKQTDGTLLAGAVSFGKGVVPPM
jgi:hypothetical protein